MKTYFRIPAILIIAFLCAFGGVVNKTQAQSDVVYFALNGAGGDRIRCTTKMPAEYLGKFSNKFGQYIVLNEDGTGAFKMGKGPEVLLKWGCETDERGEMKRIHSEAQGDQYKLVFQSTNGIKFDNERAVKTFMLRLNNGLTVPTDYRNMVCINSLCK